MERKLKLFVNISLTLLGSGIITAILLLMGYFTWKHTLLIVAIITGLSILKDLYLTNQITNLITVLTREKKRCHDKNSSIKSYYSCNNQHCKKLGYCRKG